MCLCYTWEYSSVQATRYSLPSWLPCTIPGCTGAPHGQYDPSECSLISQPDSPSKPTCQSHTVNEQHDMVVLYVYVYLPWYQKTSKSSLWIRGALMHWLKTVNISRSASFHNDQVAVENLIQNFSMATCSSWCPSLNKCAWSTPVNAIMGKRGPVL